MKKKQPVMIAVAILACWLILAIAFSAGKLSTGSAGTSAEFGFNPLTHEKDEVTGPFTLKAVATFLLQ